MPILVNMRMSIHQTIPSSAQVQKGGRRLAGRPRVLGIAAALYTGSTGFAIILLQSAPVVRVRGFDLSSLVPFAMGSWTVLSVLLVVLATSKGRVRRGLPDV